MLKIRLGDITKIETQAMVNSANPSLLAGGGVCGAIHRVAGPQLKVACRAIGKIVAGEAVLTRAFDLPAEFVIHAVAPRFFDGERHEAATLKQTYISICKVLAVIQITSVTLPSLGTGIYRFPLHLAATIACQTLYDHLPTNCEATIIGFDQETVDAYRSASTATIGLPHSAP
jgi:O-acetyl-ADP-ribose deacetylase (regulator of RNase III)